MADVRTEETTTSWSTASGLLWIALNKVGTWTLIQVELLPHTVRSTLTQLDVFIKKKKNESSCFNPVDFCTFVHICFGVVCLFCCFLLLLLYSYDQFWNDAVSGLPVFQPFFFSPVWFFSPQKNESSYSSQNIRRILWSLLLNSWTHLCGIKPSVKRRFVYSKY